MIHRSLALLAILVLTALPAEAQQSDRRARDEPEIFVDAGGRVGPADALLFSPDGQFLLAGGDDKVVRVWPHSATGLDSSKAQVLRWRAWREQRGGIKAIAISPDGKRVAIGGYGMKPSTVALIDRESGATLALSWPLSRPGVDHFGTVMAVAFDPEGKRIAFGTADGSLWIWDPAPLEKPDKAGRTTLPPLWAGRHERIPRSEFNFPRLLYFSDADSLHSIAQSGEVIASDLKQKLGNSPSQPSPSKPRFNVNDGSPTRYTVYRAVVSGDGKWLAIACAGPRVILRTTDGKKSLTIPLKLDEFPRSIAIRGNRLAIGVGSALPGEAGKPRFYAEGNDRILLFNEAFAPDPQAATLDHRGPAEALAFHPKEDRLAIAGGDADEVALLELNHPEKPVSVIRGAGRRIWSVAISESGGVLGVQTQRDPASTRPNGKGEGNWSRFDLARLRPTADESQPWLKPLIEADGWRIEPDAQDRFTWYAVRKAEGPEIRLKLALDRARDQAPTCYTFLPSTGKRPTRVLVGHYYGASLFELTPNKAIHAKMFTGHAGEVISIVAAKDQSWFVTGGADHTVAAWSLADWPSQAGLGASFAVVDGKPEVASLDIGSPAWEAGLRVGDALDLLAVGGSLVFDRRPGKKAFGTIEGAAAALKNPRPRVELFFGWVSRGQAKRRESLTTVRQRPMWKWFPAFNDRGRMTDWVIWMWHGSYYHTKSAHGDRLVGWHVNAPEPGGRPQFYRLQQFEKIFHRLDAIEKLVATRDVGAAITAVRGKNPLPVSFSQFEPAPVNLAIGRSVVAKQGLPLKVSAKPRGNNPDLLPERVELWLNDYRLEVWPKPNGKALDGKQPFETPVLIPPGKFRSGENQLAVLTFNSAGGRAEAVRTVMNPAVKRDINLIGLSVGINDYPGFKGAGGARSQGDLANADRDAREMAKSLLAYRGPDKFFRAGEVEVRLQGDAGRKDLLQSLGAFSKAAKPDDILVVFFAGHGDLLLPGAKGGFITDSIKPGVSLSGARGIASGGGLFVFCCHDYTLKNPKSTSLSAEELFDGLAQVNCRKVVLLDACHSGQAAEANVIRRVAPNGQGPFVIAACDQHELSYEHPRLKHGLFTYAVLDALGNGFRRADLDSDGQLTANELFDYTSVRVPSLIRQLNLKGRAQNPICFPRRPPKFPVVKR